MSLTVPDCLVPPFAHQILQDTDEQQKESLQAALERWNLNVCVHLMVNGAEEVGNFTLRASAGRR